MAEIKAMKPQSGCLQSHIGIPGESAYGFGRHDWQLGRVSTGDITGSLQSAAVRPIASKRPASVSLSRSFIWHP